LKKLVPILVGILSVSFTILPEQDRCNDENVVTATTSSTKNIDAEAAELYAQIGLDQLGLSESAFQYAFKGYRNLLNANRISKSEYLTICDFSQSSRNKRLYVIDIENRELIINTWVAHGRNSGAEYATRFSNKAESLQSSLGFYITRDTYIGKHGLSLRIDGLEKGINDKAMMRTIVIHGAAYVDGSRLNAGLYMGRSWGCPAVPQNESAHIITTIKNGTCLFIYHPKKDYLLGSKILNG